MKLQKITTKQNGKNLMLSMQPAAQAFWHKACQNQGLERLQELTQVPMLSNQRITQGKVVWFLRINPLRMFKINLIQLCVLMCLNILMIKRVIQKSAWSQLDLREVIYFCLLTHRQMLVSFLCLIRINKLCLLWLLKAIILRSISAK